METRRRDAPASPTCQAYAERLNRFVFRSGFIMKPLFSAAQGGAASASSTPRARTSACCAPRRSIVEEGLARPILIGRPTRRRDAAQALRPDDPARARFRAHQSRGRPALPRLCRRPMSSTPAGRASRRTRRARSCAPTPTVIARARGAARRGRRADLRARRPLHARSCGTSATSSAWRPGVREFAALEPDHHRRRAPSSSPTRMCSPTRPRRRSPRWRSPAPSTSSASASSRRSRSVATPISAPPTRRRRARCAHALAILIASARRISRSTARCRPTRRCRRRVRDRVLPGSRLTGEANVLDHAQPRRGEHRLSSSRRCWRTPCRSGRS